MKICMLIDSWKPIWAGGQIHVWELCRELIQNHNCQIDLFVMNLKDKERHSSLEMYFNKKLKIFKVGKPTEFAVLPRLRWCYQVVKLIKRIDKKINYDLIHAHSDLPALPGKILAKMLKKPIVYTVHVSSFYWKDNKNPLRYVEKLFHQYFKYDYLLPVGSYLLNYPLRTKKRLVIGNGTNLKIKHKPKNKNKTKTILFVGRLHKQKGVDFLIKSLKLVKTDCRLRIIGDGELKEEMVNLTKKLNIQNKIDFVGWVDHNKIEEEYKKADVFVLSSRFEGFGIVILEALASSVPVITTKSGGPEDIIKEGRNGFLVDFGNKKQLANRLDTVLNLNENNLRKLREEGYKTLNIFTWPKVAEKVYRAYTEARKKFK